MIFKFQQWQIRREVKHHLLSNLPESELVLIKRSAETTTFRLFDSDEFRYGGDMYDVVRKEYHGNITWYYCYADTKETKILEKINDLVKDHMEHNSDNAKSRLGSQRLLLSLLHAERQQTLVFDNPIAFLESRYSFPLKTWVSIPLTGPPQFV